MNKILIVDDNPQNLYMLGILLKTNGFEVDQASNGVDALEVTSKSLPDMVIADILMPVMDGFTLCRRWMADERLRGIPFVFYTATYTDPKDEVLALNLGATKFLVKPMAPEEFLAAVQDVFKTYRAGDPIVSPQPVQKEEEYYKEYSEVLIHKLEDKMEQIERANKHLTALYQASCNLVKVKSSNDLIHDILYTIVEIAGYQQAYYFYFDESRNKLSLLDAVRSSEEAPKILKEQPDFYLGEEQGLVGLVAQNRQPINIGDTLKESRWIVLDPRIHSALFIPVHYKERLLGVIELLSEEKDAFSEEDMRNIVTLANSLAVSIENKKVEETVNTQNILLTALINSPSDYFIFSLDRNYRYTTFNEKHRLEMQKVWHVDIDNGMNFLEMITVPELHESIQKSILRALNGEAFIEIQYQTDADIYYEFNWNPVRLNDDVVVGVTAFIRDITERKQAEEKLIKSEIKYRRLHETMVDAYASVNMAGTITEVNRSFISLVGYSMDELSQLSYKDITPEKWSSFETQILNEQIIPRGFSDVYEKEYRRKDGTIFPVELRTFLITDDNNQPTGIWAIVRDITERKEAEQKIRQLNTELEQRVHDRTAKLEAANKELESFSYSVSHDLRAPLRAISGFSEIIARRHKSSLNEEGQHYFDNIVDASKRMERLIDDLLQYSRLGQRGVRHEPVQLVDIFTDLATDLNQRLSQNQDIISIASDLPTLNSDRTLLTQIFTNLLDNALIYRPKDKPAQVSVTWETDDKGYIISVRDNGIGIPVEYLEKIFNVFQRLHSQQEYPGTGIGLATVKKSVQLLGGNIRVESQVGIGSIFHVYLPRE
jgi:PAS domain S-box-containing protein